MVLLSPFLRVPIIKFPAIMKMMPAGRGKWNRHALAPSDNFFTQVSLFLFFFVKNAKNENRLCPLPHEEVLEAIIKAVWTEQCENLQELRYPLGRLH